ncbi:hypothetical protein [Streptomyces sp. NPDC058280]|uniref:hypothetical protein n=1 Tax=Streptomyces sp. NPDC058280 TaxID=3346419 RepID=UPI0036E224BF
MPALASALKWIRELLFQIAVYAVVAVLSVLALLGLLHLFTAGVSTSVLIWAIYDAIRG